MAREGVPPRRRDLPLRQAVAAVQECTLSGQKKEPNGLTDQMSAHDENETRLLVVHAQIVRLVVISRLLIGRLGF